MWNERIRDAPTMVGDVLDALSCITHVWAEPSAMLEMRMGITFAPQATPATPVALLVAAATAPLTRVRG